METAGAAGVFTSALAIPGQPEHVRAARAFTRLVLGIHDRDDDGVAALLVTELISNSLAHSDSGKPGGTIAISVTVTPGGLLVEVTDDGAGGGPVLREPADVEAERGRGLRLVDELSDAWGHFGWEGRMVTWFALKAGQAS